MTRDREQGSWVVTIVTTRHRTIAWRVTPLSRLVTAHTSPGNAFTFILFQLYMHIFIPSFIFLLICLYISCSFTFITFVLFYLLSKFIKLFKGKVVSFPRMDMTFHSITPFHYNLPLTHLFKTILTHFWLSPFRIPTHFLHTHNFNFKFLSILLSSSTLSSSLTLSSYPYPKPYTFSFLFSFHSFLSNQNTFCP